MATKIIAPEGARPTCNSAKAATAATASKAGTAAAPIEDEHSTPARAIGAQVEAWRTVGIEARDAISNLLSEAIDLDEEERINSCGFAKRLMDLAMCEIDQFLSKSSKDYFESIAFNVEALIYGALELTTDPVGTSVRAKLQHALAIVDKLTDTLAGGEGVAPILAAIYAAPETRPLSQAAGSMSAGKGTTYREHTFFPFSVTMQARDVCRSLAESYSGPADESDALWGLFNLLDRNTETVRVAIEEEPDDIHAQDRASEELASTIGLYNILANGGELETGLLYAVETLLFVAKQALDDHIAAKRQVAARSKQ